MFVLARHELQRRFIAYIVDLTCIMHILFMLTLGENGPYRERPTITRRLVKASYMSYYESQLKAHVHREIRKYDGSKNPIARVRRDNAFELIKELLHTLVKKTTRHGDADSDLTRAVPMFSYYTTSSQR